MHSLAIARSVTAKIKLLYFIPRNCVPRHAYPVPRPCAQPSAVMFAGGKLIARVVPRKGPAWTRNRPPEHAVGNSWPHSPGLCQRPPKHLPWVIAILGAPARPPSSPWCDTNPQAGGCCSAPFLHSKHFLKIVLMSTCTVKYRSSTLKASTPKNTELVTTSEKAQSLPSGLKCRNLVSLKCPDAWSYLVRERIKPHSPSTHRHQLISLADYIVEETVRERVS